MASLGPYRCNRRPAPAHPPPRQRVWLAVAGSTLVAVFVSGLVVAPGLTFGLALSTAFLLSFPLFVGRAAGP